MILHLDHGKCILVDSRSMYLILLINFGESENDNVTSKTRFTNSTIVMYVSESYTISYFERCNIRTNFLYNACSFMTQNHIPMKNVFICTTNSGMSDLYHDFIFSEFSMSSTFHNPVLRSFKYREINCVNCHLVIACLERLSENMDV